MGIRSCACLGSPIHGGPSGQLADCQSGVLLQGHPLSITMSRCLPDPCNMAPFGTERRRGWWSGRVCPSRELEAQPLPWLPTFILLLSPKITAPTVRPGWQGVKVLQGKPSLFLVECKAGRVRFCVKGTNWASLRLRESGLHMSQADPGSQQPPLKTHFSSCASQHRAHHHHPPTVHQTVQVIAPASASTLPCLCTLCPTCPEILTVAMILQAASIPCFF